MRVFRELLSVCVCASFPFEFKGGMWDFIVLVPDQCLAFYFAICNTDLLSLSSAGQTVKSQFSGFQRVSGFTF